MLYTPTVAHTEKLIYFSKQDQERVKYNLIDYLWVSYGNVPTREHGFKCV